MTSPTCCLLLNQSSRHSGRWLALVPAAAGAARPGRRGGGPPAEADAAAWRLLFTVACRLSMRCAIFRFSAAICSIRWRSLSRDALTLRHITPAQRDSSRSYRKLIAVVWNTTEYVIPSRSSSPVRSFFPTPVHRSTDAPWPLLRLFFWLSFKALSHLSDYSVGFRSACHSLTVLNQRRHRRQIFAVQTSQLHVNNTCKKMITRSPQKLQISVLFDSMCVQNILLLLLQIQYY